MKTRRKLEWNNTTVRGAYQQIDQIPENSDLRGFLYQNERGSWSINTPPPRALNRSGMVVIAGQNSRYPGGNTVLF